jgi:hypothetical protein
VQQLIQIYTNTDCYLILHLDPNHAQDCSYVVAAGGAGTGGANNVCHVDCSNRGICDFEKGKCKCHNGFFGGNCGQTDARAVNARML